MMRIMLSCFIALLLAFAFLQGKFMDRNFEKPVFLRTDAIADSHKTTIEIKINSARKPDSSQLQILKKDYSNIWAHLNHLYTSNEVEAGKEYYTEDWFKQICSHYDGIQQTGIQRVDEQHILQIENWDPDGLVCTAIDRDLVFRYSYADGSIKHSKAKLAIVLLFQGDHWRIDAIRVINDEPI